ncbi:gliding motility lipoprotein GldH [Flavihumibacter sp. UBA7668]|uniref:gliding motility lipoprotein GldH n=1 Tax=Flavihumibacter sp. UBA7668 TaxID=1946542 RepID=UPI0025B9AFE0|nr:gliding motility lipoprotein GldH [Flavihumibacter sp. UBA7668]
MKRFQLPGFLIAVAVSISSCQTIDVYERNAALENHRWQAGDKPTFDFTIQDTLARYNIFVVVRHADAYRYNNLWVNIHTKAPGDSTSRVQALDLQLATSEKGWLGAGMDDIYEHRIRISQAPVSLKAGTYQFSLEQIMRDDPLEHVLNVGVRVEKEPD